MQQKACKIAMKIDYSGQSLLTHLLPWWLRIIKFKNACKKEQVRFYSHWWIRNVCGYTWEYFSPESQAPYSSCIKTGELRSTATITNMSCNRAACYTKTAAFLLEITLTRFLSLKNWSEPTGSKCHLLEVHILYLLLLLLHKTTTKHSGSQFLQFCIPPPAAAEL